MLRVAILAVTCAATATANVVNSAAKNNNVGLQLVILHNNDMHARFEQTSRLSGLCSVADRESGKCYGGFARVAYEVKNARAAAAATGGPPVLYLNAGDTYTGTAWFTLFKWEIAADFVNALHPDAVSLGNHEFDHGVPGLRPFIRNLNAPVLAANLNLTKVPELAAEINLHKSIVYNITGVKVGIIGYLTPDTKFLAIRNDVEYIDEVSALREEVAHLKEQGVEILIALGHSGWDMDRKIAREVEGIDIVIGGHTNTFLWNGMQPDEEHVQGPYPTIVKQASGRMVPAVQAYAYTKYLGKLHLTFDDEGELVEYDGNPILLDNSVPQDPEVLEIINRYRENVTRVSERVVGTSVVRLDGDCRLHECNLGNLIADATVYYHAINHVGPHWTDAPIAVIQGGGVRASIDLEDRLKNITKGDLLAVLPFDTTIVAVTMNGTTLLRLVEYSISGYNPESATGQFLQYSGVRVTYDLSKPVGQRTMSVRARCWDCFVPQFYEIDSWRDYKVLMPEFLAEGGDGFSFLVDLPREALSWKDIDALEDYIARRSPVYPEVADRVVLLNEDQLVISEPEPEEHPDESGATALSTSVAALFVMVMSLLNLTV